MSFDELWADALDLAPPPLLGDFYREPDEVVRGITLGSSAFDFDSIDDVWNPALPSPWDALKEVGESTTIRSSPGQVSRFPSGQEGRIVPADSCFFLEKTTQYLPMLPSTAANHVLDFLEQEVISSITKVNHKKASIKAEVFHMNLACQMKVYIYQQECGCAVEFQKRSGDGISFRGVYEKASEYLMQCTASSKSLFMSAPSAVYVSPGSSQPTEDSVALLTEIAQQAPHLQDEIASSILGMAEEDPEMPDRLCKPEALDVLLQLLASDRFGAAYPAARLMALLSGAPEVRSRFFDEGVLKAVLSRLWVQATGMAVWIQIASLVHGVVAAHVMYMTNKDRQEAASAIATALELEPSDCDLKTIRNCACASQQLRDTLHLLDNSVAHVHHSSSNGLLAYQAF
jgi:hypothetical protein